MMTKTEQLNEFFEDMFSRNWEELGAGNGEKYRKMRQEHIDEMLESNLTYDQQRFIEEILFELHLSAEIDSRMLYQQGIRDGVWLLKNLGVIA